MRGRGVRKQVAGYERWWGSGLFSHPSNSVAASSAWTLAVSCWTIACAFLTDSIRLPMLKGLPPPPPCLQEGQRKATESQKARGKGEGEGGMLWKRVAPLRLHEAAPCAPTAVCCMRQAAWSTHNAPPQSAICPSARACVISVCMPP